MRSKLICDARYLLRAKGRLVSALVITVLASILTLSACRGMTVAWYFLKRAAFTLPLFFICALYILASALFGIIWCCVSLNIHKNRNSYLSCALAFAVYLFWFPLFVMSRVHILAIFAIFVSLLCLFCSIARLRMLKALTAFFVALLLLVLLYFAYISIGAAVGI